ncbi:hypothetical protein PSHT_08035, partial [Puccinia striiformis]
VKTTKALQSKKGKAVLSKLHPHSRRAKQNTRIALRDDKLALNKKEKQRLGNALTSRLIWFIEANKQETRTVDPSSNNPMTKFINRNSNQIQEESNKRSNHFSDSRPKSSSLAKLESLVRQELLEYSTDGFVMPDLRTAENLKLLDLWKDEHRCDPPLMIMTMMMMLRLLKSTNEFSSSHNTDKTISLLKTTHLLSCFSNILLLLILGWL